MPLKSGYSYKTFLENFKELEKSGYEKRDALAAAFASARHHWFDKFPQGHLPTWLQWPKGKARKDDYTDTGHPIRSNPLPFVLSNMIRERTVAHAFKTNPSRTKKTTNKGPDKKELSKAISLFEKFTGHDAVQVTPIKVPPMPKTGVCIGELDHVGYISTRDGQPYRHTFRKNSRPLLVASHDGKLVVIVGGRYAFTDAGIEDR